MANENNRTFMTGDEMTPMGNFFNVYAEFVAYLKARSHIICHKEKSKGVSSTLCT
jgi:hypothetical protein